MKLRFALACLVIGSLASFNAAAEDWKTVEAEKFGYKVKIPKSFERQGTIEETTSWIQSGGAAESGKKTKKKRGFSAKLRVKGVSVGGSKSEEETSSSGGSSGGDVLQVYVNWVYMPDVGSGTMYKTNYDSVKKGIDGPNSKYKDIKALNMSGGEAFWYKEVDKSDNGEIHRWHIQAYGNKSAYTIGLTGPYGAFENNADIFKEIVDNFELIPLKE
jgi:hypothetical protein